jgi:hypothetical protein
MIKHADLGIAPFARSRQLKLMILSDVIRLAGNSKLKIYGQLNCRSGKRMKLDNRVFFTGEAEAIASGYRPCGHCMPDDYQNWASTKQYQHLFNKRPTGSSVLR